MAGLFSVGGLISGLDSNSIISQLIAIERQPIARIKSKVTSLTAQQTGVREARTKLLVLRNLFKDFQLGLKFKDFQAPSSNEAVLKATATGSSPMQGSFQVEVLQLATASVARSSSRLGAPIDPGVALSSSGISAGITAGTFTVNGVQFNVNPATDSLNSIIGQINGSAAGVTATYNAGTDTVSLENTAAGNTAIINFGATGDTSNLLSVLGAPGAVQTTGLNGSTVVTGNRILGAVSTVNVLNTVSFASGAVTAGNFRVNGVTITVDPTVDTLGDVLSRINASGAGVTATVDLATDTIRVVSKNLGSRTIAFQDGTSNFLTRTNLTAATQTAGQDAQYRLDAGAVQTSNSNDVTTAISGVTLNFRSVGTSTVSVSANVDGIVKTVQSFITSFNESVAALNSRTKKGGVLEGDSTLRSIESYLRGNVFTRVAGLPGSVESLRDIGISTGDSFDATAVFELKLDETKLRAAIGDNRAGVEALFTNSSATGIADSLFSFLDGATASSGYLNERARAGGSIDTQIQSANDRIAALERTVALREKRLRAQFTQLETLTASLQSQGASLNSLG
jgi:flagellar hook-associated protein 2